jgi:hypothetical protein
MKSVWIKFNNMSGSLKILRTIMAKLTQLQIEQLQSFGYMVRGNEDIDKMEKQLKDNAKANKPTSVKKDSLVVEDVEDDDEFSYLDELET